MYTVHLSRSSVKEIKKRGRKFKEKVKEIGQKLSKNPHSLQAERLKKPFQLVYSYHFSFPGSTYRLAFTIDKNNKNVYVVLVAPRENFYKRLRKMLS